MRMLITRHFLRRPYHYDLPACLASFGAQIDNPIRFRNQIEVVLNHNNRMSHID